MEKYLRCIKDIKKYKLKVNDIVYYRYNDDYDLFIFYDVYDTPLFSRKINNIDDDKMIEYLKEYFAPIIKK